MIGRHLAPAGSPIGSGDLLRWCRRWTRLTGSGLELRASICTALDRRHCFLTSTGRAGLTVLLSALKSLASPDRNVVILPSYTCYSVAASTVRAGLRIRIVDIDSRSLDFDLEKLGNARFGNVLAVVVTSLYGMPGQLSKIADLAQDRGVFLVDDAAQSLGARLHNLPSGAWGDAGLLSFDKGKAVSAIDGGAVVTNSGPVAEAVEDRIKQLPRPGAGTTAWHAVKLGAYVTCLRPEMYWIPNALPGIGLGETRYAPDFAIESESPWLAALGATMWPRLEEFRRTRVSNAARYLAGIPVNDAVAPVEPVDGAQPSYLRFPILVGDAAMRARLLRDLVSAGIGATPSYPGSLADIPELRTALSSPPDAHAGRRVAGSIVTLPTHPYVSARDIDRTVDILAEVVGKGR